jgi:hypothetical protein
MALTDNPLRIASVAESSPIQRLVQQTTTHCRQPIESAKIAGFFHEWHPGRGISAYKSERVIQSFGVDLADRLSDESGSEAPFHATRLRVIR